MMQTRSVQREGSHAVLEDREDTPDHVGVLKRTRLDAQTAIDIGDAMAAIGHQILADLKQPYE